MLQTKQINFYKKWRLVRKNKVKFIAKHSLLLWALPFAVIMSVFKFADNKFTFSITIIKAFSLCFIISAIIGIIAERYNFNKHEKKFKELKRKKLI